PRVVQRFGDLALLDGKHVRELARTLAQLVRPEVAVAAVGEVAQHSTSGRVLSRERVDELLLGAHCRGGKVRRRLGRCGHIGSSMWLKNSQYDQNNASSLTRHPIQPCSCFPASSSDGNSWRSTTSVAFSRSWNSIVTMLSIGRSFQLQV